MIIVPFTTRRCYPITLSFPIIITMGYCIGHVGALARADFS